MEEKICNKCNKSKYICEFAKGKYNNIEYYRNECKQCRNLAREIWKNNNKTKFDEYLKNNKEHINNLRNKRRNERMQTDPLFRLQKLFKDKLKRAFKKNNLTKNSKTVDILGCSFEEFKIYLESKFEPWMNWNNKGLYNNEPNYGWDIDHIIPISTAITEEDIISLNHYSNLQPLCSYYNRHIKKDTSK